MVRGRCHLNVSAIMKKCPNDTEIIIIALRNKLNFEKIAVKKFRQFPIILDDVVSATPSTKGLNWRQDKFAIIPTLFSFFFCRFLKVQSSEIFWHDVKSKCKR